MRLTKRQRWLLGTLALAGLGWAVDALTRGGPPTAQAGPAPASPLAARAVAWEDIRGVVDQLTHTEYASVAVDLGALTRDLFVPAEPLAAESPALDDAEAEDVVSEEPALAEPAAPPEVPFEERHRLNGVLIGRNPLAVVDDKLVPLNSDLDGFILWEVHRDFVVFREREGSRSVTLVLAPDSGKP